MKIIKKQRDNKKTDSKQRGNTELLLSKERKTLKNIYNKSLDKVHELFNNLMSWHHVLKFAISSTGLETNFSELKDPVAFLDSIRNTWSIDRSSTI